MADPIKQVVKDVFQLTDFQTYDEIEREQQLEHWPDWTPRKLFQFVGTQSFRELIDPQIWVKSLWLRMQNDLEVDPDRSFVITDLRFPDELEFFKEKALDGHVFQSIKVTRLNCDGNVGIQGHATESHDLDADYTIENNSSILALHQKVNNTIGTITVKWIEGTINENS